MRVFDRSTGQYVRPVGPARSNSALEARQSLRGHIEHMHGVDPLISRAPRPWYAVGQYLCWPGPLDHPLSLDITALENARLIPTQPQAPVNRLRPVGNVSRLVSLTEIATRFGVEQDAIQTLNASAAKSGALKFIVLLENDKSDDHGCYRRLVVSAKVNLHLLPGHELPYPDQDFGEFEHESTQPCGLGSFFLVGSMQQRLANSILSLYSPKFDLSVSPKHLSSWADFRPGQDARAKKWKSLESGSRERVGQDQVKSLVFLMMELGLVSADIVGGQYHQNVDSNSID
ncbi:hypothetical protein KCU90_g139, partial [Aureobasidium melanogenum]